jgi:hypothetical protein
MTTEYGASVRIEDGNLTVTRPHPAPGPIDDLIDDLVYRIRDGETTILGVEVTVEVDDTNDPQPEAPSGTSPSTPPAQTGTGALPPVPTSAPDPLAPSGA